MLNHDKDSMIPMQPWQSELIIQLSNTIIRSFQARLQYPLAGLPAHASAETLARALYDAPYVVLTHDGDSDPRFTYANRAAQQLWELEWEEIIGMPSRYSAEPDLREVRAAMLERVQRDGYIDDYQGIRISKTGKRFALGRTVVWNLTDADDHYCGQAATFSEWTALGASAASSKSGEQ
ncbi:MEKHLA domain-containing protein [Pontibacterium granulatum]|uniref:MEKHLA domain-containing protein n=1 Tax=Pontibacterium granulatum TaxID=2036029 RepID=UPI00249AA522|nr:MEKHLA domain-containing protein [Pontibacterium granulatum]MDI3325725.1 MEKHLA domain-containing protein [Pontibacterium granulatum]